MRRRRQLHALVAGYAPPSRQGREVCLQHLSNRGSNARRHACPQATRPYDNTFGRATLGLEALGSDLDLRANAYLGLGGSVDTPELNSVGVSGSSLLVYGGLEEAMSGVDAEIGWRVPVFALDSTSQLRVYGGGYHFASDHTDLTGARLRLELSMADLEALGPGSRLGLSGSIQHDDTYGTRGFAGFSLRVPLGGEAGAGSLSPDHRRMADPVVREKALMTAGGGFGAGEVATTADGQAITYLDGDVVSGADLQARLDTAGTDSTVVLAGLFSSTTQLYLKEGQTLLGGGTLALSTLSGKSIDVALSGATLATELSTNGSPAALNMANNSTVAGLTLNVTTAAPSIVINPRGIEASGVTGATIRDNVVTVTSDYAAAVAIGVEESTNVVVAGNRATGSNTVGGNAAGILVLDSSVRITDNVVASYSSGGAYGFYLVAYDGNLTIQSGSTGNVITAAGCSNMELSASIIGSIGLADGGTCP